MMKNKSCFENAIAIMGGTFDPIHNGHLHVATSVIEAFNIKKVLFVPAGISPFKKHSKNNKTHRQQMVSIAIDPYQNFFIEDIEIKKSETSYTIDTIKEIKKSYDNIYLIIGADNLSDILKWKEIGLLFLMCEIIVVSRGSIDDRIDKYRKVLENNENISIEKKLQEMGAIIHTLKIPLFDISSTEIRNRIEANKDVYHLVPEGVLKYINNNNLYKDQTSLDIKHLFQTLEENISPKRFRHIQGVCDKAKELSLVYGESQTKSQIAALFHDWAKEYTLDDMKESCNIYGFKPDIFIREEMGICHGFLAAEIAYKEYKITDKDILNAIRYHTTGRANMSTLEKIIFIADVIEINREDTSSIRELRHLAYTNLNKAIFVTLKFNLYKSISRGRIFHPLGLQALTYYSTFIEE